ncbi:hypothetical protein ACLK1S_00525 [Escherichia coli]
MATNRTRADIARVLKTSGEGVLPNALPAPLSSVTANSRYPHQRTGGCVATDAGESKFKHPATRTFQAVRRVNSELEEMSRR